MPGPISTLQSNQTMYAKIHPTDLTKHRHTGTILIELFIDDMKNELAIVDTQTQELDRSDWNFNKEVGEVCIHSTLTSLNDIKSALKKAQNEEWKMDTICDLIDLKEKFEITLNKLLSLSDAPSENIQANLDIESVNINNLQPADNPAEDSEKNEVAVQNKEFYRQKNEESFSIIRSKLRYNSNTFMVAALLWLVPFFFMFVPVIIIPTFRRDFKNLLRQRRFLKTSSEKWNPKQCIIAGTEERKVIASRNPQNRFYVHKTANQSLTELHQEMQLNDLDPNWVVFDGHCDPGLDYMNNDDKSQLTNVDELAETYQSQSNVKVIELRGCSTGVSTSHSQSMAEQTSLRLPNTAIIGTTKTLFDDFSKNRSYTKKYKFFSVGMRQSTNIWINGEEVTGKIKTAILRSRRNPKKVKDLINQWIRKQAIKQLGDGSLTLDGQTFTGKFTRFNTVKNHIHYLICTNNKGEIHVFRNVDGHSTVKVNAEEQNGVLTDFANIEESIG
ncbi:MAG: hypothetical protein HRT90_02910 [Candidatus Margulisbacteria bacterium]|nr:hypothetical protein [Candidatus Margulisiibacteriota bacterium]